MLKAKFSEEGWHISNLYKRLHDVFKIYSGSCQVAQVSTDGARNDSDKNKANAILISHAPKMLKFLMDIVSLQEERQKEVEEFDDAEPSDIDKWGRLQEVEHKFAIKESELMEQIEDFLKEVEPDLFEPLR